MNMNQIIAMLDSISKEHEVDYAYNRVYKYGGSNNDKVIVTDCGTILFLFDESGTLQDLWSFE